MRFIIKVLIYTISIALIQSQTGCNKLVQIAPPINSVSATKSFSTDNTATAAVIAIYNNMRIGLTLFNGGTTIYTGQSADELDDGGGLYNQFLSNSLTKDNGSPSTVFWTPAYYDIFMENAVIEGLTASSTVSAKTKGQLVGEAKFLRAFCYFYLVNLFGDVPLVLSSDFNKTSSLPRMHVDQVYQQIKNDLIDAENLLITDYSNSNEERIRANKWAATALLARTYLYQKKWDSAITQASAVINSGTYALDSLNGAFLKNSVESIFQLQTTDASPWATTEAGYFIRPNRTSYPYYYLDTQLLNAFENGDKRRSAWVDSTIAGGITYYYPSKYKVRIAMPASNITEYYTLLRLAEQYLIRAEAQVQLGNLQSAVNDLDTLRTRAGLPGLDANLSRDQILAAILQERRIELFAECGHRWFDLKRTGQAVSVLSQIPIKSGLINEDQLLYPIPVNELLKDPNLTQNPGYN